MERDEIVSEIRRLAAEADGVAPGVRRFATETGYTWRQGRFWARWNDAIIEAGLLPNTAKEAHTEEVLLQAVAMLAQELGRFPAYADLRLRRATDPNFPSSDAIQRRFTPVATLISAVADYAANHAGFDDVHEICVARLASTPAAGERSQAGTGADDQFVYLMKAGRNYKLGRSNSVGRRHYELVVRR